ncbi:MAG TPA: heme ABC exporter ATP-binding protein CcmA [Caulobacteraceae bacterium]
MLTGLAIEGLAVERGARRLFEGVSLTLARGELLTLTGANGAGKTSLLRAVAGFLRPQAGDIRFEGQDAEDARAESLHYLGHQDGLKPARTAWEELCFQAQWCGGTRESAKAAVEALALQPLLDLEIRKLSAGQRRRVALARLIAAPRPLWLLDEPMAPLDAERRSGFGALMAQHLQGSGLILAAAHDPFPVPGRTVQIGASA